MKYVFWNTHKNENINIYLQKLVEVYKPDVIGLAEYMADGEALVQSLKEQGIKYSFIPKIASRLDMFYKGSRRQVLDCNDARHYTIKVVSKNKEKQILAIVHFPSKRYATDSGNEEILGDILSDINKIRSKKHINNFVIVGDFNMNPYEKPMVNATSLQAISSKEIVIGRKQRTYIDKRREFLYNPMWNFLGDEKDPIGSYYYNSPQNEAMYWNTFDQFVVNDGLADKICFDKIEFVTNIDSFELRGENGAPKVSDHFPLYFEIGEEK